LKPKAELQAIIDVIASADSPVGMEHLLGATRREYQKMGKLCTEGDFAQYFELVKG